MDEASHRQGPRARHDGWTRERQAIFLATLETTGNVRSAAIAAGMNRAGAYRFRERPGGERFGHAWDLALARRRQRLVEERLAKATLALLQLSKGDKGDSASRARSPRESDEGNIRGESPRHCQNRQHCRFTPTSSSPVPGRGDGMPR